MELSDDRKRCPICLDTIARESEAFLDHCFHKFCYHCILQWSDMAVAHLSGPVQSLECPLCKNRYVSIIHNLHGKKFQRHYITPSRGRSTGFFMSQAHMRRQAVYSVQQGHEGRSTIPSMEVGLAQNRVPTSQFSADSISRAGRNRWLQCWVQRELQALMEEEDVQIVMHHVMGVIDFYGSRSKKGTHEVNKKETRQKDWRKALASAVQPFLFENALKFVEELEKFLVSGLDIAAFDDLGKSEHVAEENQIIPDGIRDLKDVESEKGEHIQEDGEWGGNHVNHSERETIDLKRDMAEGQLMHPSAQPTTSVDGLASCRDGNCSDGVCGRGPQSRRKTKHNSTRRLVESESDTPSPVHRHKNKKKHRHKHRSAERERGRSPHSRKKKKSNSLSPPRQARTRDKATRKTTEFGDMSQEQVQRKRRHTEDILSRAHSRRSRSRSQGASKRARNKVALLGDNTKVVRYKKRKSRRRGNEPEESCANTSSNSSGEEDRLFTSLLETNKPDLALRKEKENSRDNQILTFDSLDAEKLDDATLEAEIQEMKLRQQALSNLMKHLEDSRRRRMEAATLEIVASADAGALEPPSSHSSEFDRYSPEKGGGYDLPSFCRESAGGWEKSSEERLDEHVSYTLTSNMPNVLQERVRPTSYDVSSSILDHPAPEPESGKDAPSGDGSRKLKVPLRLEVSGQSAGKCGKKLKPEFRVVITGADDVNNVTGGAVPSLKIPATRGRLDQRNRDTSLVPDNVDRARNKDNLIGSKREEDVVAVATSSGHKKQPRHPSSVTGPDSRPQQSSNQQRRIKIHRDSDSDAPSHSNVVGGSDHQNCPVVIPPAPASEKCNKEVAVGIHCDESAQEHLSLVSERVGCEEKDTVCSDGQEANLVLANGEESVAHSNLGQTRHEETRGQGVNTLCVVNEAGTSSAVDVVEPCTAQSAGGHEIDRSVREELPSDSPVDINSMRVSSVADQDAELCDAGKHPSKQAVSSAASPALEHLGSDGSDQVALADGGQGTESAPSTSGLKSESLSNKDGSGVLPPGSQQEIVDSSKPSLPEIDSDRFKQKTMSVMRGGELVEVSYKVYIPPQAAARAARRKLRR